MRILFNLWDHLNDPKYVASLLILMGLLILGGCSTGDTSSNACTTFTDANNNPVTQCGQSIPSGSSL